jgi:hypothetical protein
MACALVALLLVALAWKGVHKKLSGRYEGMISDSRSFLGALALLKLGAEEVE